MKDPTTMWAAQAAEEQRRLAEAARPDREQRAEWASGHAGAAAASGPLSGIVRRIRRALRR